MDPAGIRIDHVEHDLLRDWLQDDHMLGQCIISVMLDGLTSSADGGYIDYSIDVNALGQCPRPEEGIPRASADQ